MIPTWAAIIAKESHRKCPRIPSHIFQHPLLHNRRNEVLLWRHIPRLGLNLLQTTLTPSTPLPTRVNALRMTTISLRTAHTFPHVLVLDLIAVLGGHFDLAPVQGMVLHCLGALPSPRLEAGAVRVIRDVGDHVICQMTVFVSNGVDKSVFVVDDALGELDRGIVCVDGTGGLLRCFPRPDSFALPVCSAGGFEESLGPGDLDTAACLRHLRDFAAGDGVIQSLEESLCEACFLIVEGEAASLCFSF